MTAAEKLRALAKAASTPPPWRPVSMLVAGVYTYWYVQREDERVLGQVLPGDARYIAALHPGVVEEIAALLEQSVGLVELDLKGPIPEIAQAWLGRYAKLADMLPEVDDGKS